jgi:hypothetical protein
LKNLALVAVVLLFLYIAFTHYGARTSAATGAAPATTSAPPAAASSTTQPTWITVRDPREQAFSIQVPQGWKTYGGLFRFSAIDARMIVDTTSPDALTNIRIGDVSIPPYRVPGPFLPTGPGVAAYVQANTFAAKYGQARFGSICTGVQTTKSDAVAPKYHPANSQFAHTTGGEAFFTCTKNGTPMSAYVYAETELLGPGGPGSTWIVATLASLIAPTAQTTAVGAMLTHIGGSLVMNPAWTAMQNNLDNQAAAMINANTQQIIAATEAENQREQSMISALNNDSFDDIINGVQETTDSSGKTYITPLGTGGPQWIDGGNNVVESGLSPGAGFSPLTSAP